MKTLSLENYMCKMKCRFCETGVLITISSESRTCAFSMVVWKLLSHIRLFATHGILQARILEWVALPFSRGSSQPRDQTQVSHITGSFFTSWATRLENVFIFTNLAFHHFQCFSKSQVIFFLCLYFSCYWYQYSNFFGVIFDLKSKEGAWQARVHIDNSQQ